MATATEPRQEERIERHPRRVRWFHAAVYLVVLPLLFTGWRLLGGDEGRPSALARIAGMSDARLHVWLGRAFALLILVPIVTGRKGIATFVRESLRRDPGDGRWWAHWPSGLSAGGSRVTRATSIRGNGSRTSSSWGA